MDPGEFRRVVVLPNVEDMQTNYGNLRASYNAVAAVDALAAHVYQWCKEHNPTAVANLRDDSHYRAWLAKQDDDFGLLRDVAKAHKHVVLTQGKPRVSGSADVSVKGLGWNEGQWGELRWNGPPQVVVRTDSGVYRAVETLVKHALRVLDDEIARVGIPTGSDEPQPADERSEA
jgi:hypothetical protein